MNGLTHINGGGPAVASEAEFASPPPWLLLSSGSPFFEEGDTLLDRVIPEDRQRILDEGNRAAAANGRVILEYSMDIPSLGTVPVQEFRCCFPGGFRSLFVAAEGFRRHETFPCRNVCSQNLVPVFRADRNFERILDCNSPFARLFGFEEPEEFLSSLCARNPFFSHAAREMALSRFDGGFLDRFEVMFRRRDGASFWGELSAVISSDGGFAGGRLTDITERRREDLLLQERNSALSMLGEISADLLEDLDMDVLLQKILDYAAIYMNTEHGAISFADHPRGERYIRWARGPLLTRWIGKRIPLTRGLGARVLASAKTMVVPDYKTYENRLPNRDFDILSTTVGVPLRWKDHTFGYLSMYYEGSPREISGAKVNYLERFAFLASMALRNAGLYEDARRELEERRKLEKELVMSREAAEQANAAKGEFLARISHEIRNPLNVLAATFDRLAGTCGDEGAAEGLRVIGTAKDHILQILNDILDLSKIEAGRMDVSVSPFSPGELAGECAALFSPQAELKGLTFSTGVSPDVPEHALGDPLRIRQILFNLLGNAVKFTSRGGVAFSVDAAPDLSGSPRLLFSVSDTGPGIPPEQEESLFEPYSRGTRPSPGDPGGTGLGLSISRRIARLLGGELTAGSTPGKGAVFTLSLPLITGGPGGEDVPKGKEEIPPVPERLTILAADDHPVNRALLSKMLSLPGRQVILASNGKEALELAKREIPDVVLLDLEMPVLDGLEAARAIRNLTPVDDPRPLLLGLTGHDRDRALPLCREAGMDGCFTKPFSAGDILGEIARRFGKSC
ncbi:MAG: ATP-binding protein [Aminivibrio sp.]|uniref:ATP-binding protein n=1 Tax=Aminivibrio sp. TaxID=1872489 RepID=UPI002B20C753|nr:ATP-binding protein [Aminivibrio sp.]MEA4952154.1 ATP-binding protein [Aminivibrio sp.]